MLNRDMDPTDDNLAAESPSCLLPELYVAADYFHKEKKKSNLLKTRGISPSEAKKTLHQNLSAMLFGGPDSKEDQPALTCTLVRREKPESMTDLLHRTLLTDSLSLMNKLNKSKQRLLQRGIPPPKHSFPYDIFFEHTNTLALEALHKKIKFTKSVFRHSHTLTTQGKVISDDRVPKYLLVDPEKQFMDLKDLEWRYYKGLVKWKHKTSYSFIDIKYNSERRFVENQLTPNIILPPLIDKSLVIYPHIGYQKM